MTKRRTPLVVSFSGGKDSTALILHLLDIGRPIAGIIRYDGGWEYDEIRQHTNQLENTTGLTVTTLHADPDFTWYFATRPVIANRDHPVEDIQAGELRTYGYGWPGPRRRWCTDLKTRAIDAAIKRLWPKLPVGIGFAADESQRILGPRQIRLRQAGKVEYPLIDAGITGQDALDISRSHGYHWNGLYDHFRRISCICCPLRSLTDWRTTRQFYPAYWRKCRSLQAICPNHHKTINHGQTVEDLEIRFAEEENGTAKQT